MTSQCPQGAFVRAAEFRTRHHFLTSVAALLKADTTQRLDVCRLRDKLRAVCRVNHRQARFDVQRQPLLAVVELCFTAQGVSDAFRRCFVGYQQEALRRVFEPQNGGRSLADQLFFSIRQLGKQVFQRCTRLETRDPQQNVFIVRGDGDFRKDRVFFQLFKLGVTQAAALNKGESVLTAEQTQVAPHFAFWIAMRGQQMLVLSQLRHVRRDLALQVFFAVRTGQCRQCPVIKSNQRQRQTRRGGGLARRKWCKCHSDVLNCLTL